MANADYETRFVGPIKRVLSAVSPIMFAGVIMFHLVTGRRFRFAALHVIALGETLQFSRSAVNFRPPS
jgi:hypothetical protein